MAAASQLALVVATAHFAYTHGANAIDDMLAREYGQQSHLGAILNEIGDVAADAALYLPLTLLTGVYATLMVVLVLLTIISEMMGVVALQIGATRQYQGPMGKSDRALRLGLLALILGAGVPIGDWVNWLLMLMQLMLVITIVNRAKGALSEVKISHANYCNLPCVAL